MQIPKGKGTREGIQYCAREGKQLGSNGLHIHRTNAGLKTIIFKSPVKPSEEKSKKFCKFIDKKNDVQCIKRPKSGCSGYCWTQYPGKKTCKFIDKENNVQCQEIKAQNCKGYYREHCPDLKEGQAIVGPDATDQDNTFKEVEKEEEDKSKEEQVEIRAEDINVNDVLCGKGIGFTSHPGKEKRRIYIKERG